jgi:predicted nuclease of predicted toxin-antitoxin system
VIRFLIDADLPRSVFAALRDRGLLADDVRDLGLGTASDDIVLQFAKTHVYTLVSADKGFTNLLRFPLGTHHGIIVVRFPRHTSARVKTRLLLQWIPTLGEEDLTGNLLIIQPKRIRIRRAKRS